MSDPEKKESNLPTKEPGEPISEMKEPGEPVTPPKEKQKKREYRELDHDEAKPSRTYFKYFAVTVYSLFRRQMPMWICRR
jgi:hypothetical protein